eukprot:CAMPEP_0174243176 /NCGR_PEP_ID=MMETSP0417-20130205/30660_1 /TAXON_ID=242541 /ORGANISM="Mayorella sp, Strain BSH-02190019" /LENGTH=157 /DNA_ID=CAMNT_0015322647 /DNA_START=94 /DNA_END=567 /DNA_ORIENTATION=+
MSIDAQMGEATCHVTLRIHTEDLAQEQREMALGQQAQEVHKGAGTPGIGEQEGELEPQCPAHAGGHGAQQTRVTVVVERTEGDHIGVEQQSDGTHTEHHTLLEPMPGVGDPTVRALRQQTSLQSMHALGAQLVELESAGVSHREADAVGAHAIQFNE